MKLNKALGQNFFNNPNLADWIVETTLSTEPKSVLEIGPGDGYFTSRFVGKVDSIIVIEKDAQLSEFLKVKLPDIKIVNQDVLDFDISLLESTDKPLVMYGSLPYNISKKIIAKFIQSKAITDFYFIVQKEVAEKYVAKDEKTSLLSLTASIYVDTVLLKTLKPGNFIPSPKVDSAFIHMKRNDNIDKITDLRGFEIFLKTAYNKPRKTLRNNIKLFISEINTSKLDNDLLSKRPEDLKFDEYINLYKQLML